LGPIPNPQSPIPNPQSPIPIEILFINLNIFKKINLIIYFNKNNQIKLIINNFMNF